MTWTDRQLPWHRTDVAYCEVTGQLLPNRYWEFEDNGRTIRARDPHCEELYWRYLHRGDGDGSDGDSSGSTDAGDQG